MKTNNFTPTPKCLMAIAAVVFFSSLIFSCKKDASQPAPPKNNMDEAAAILGGKRVSGNLSSLQEENEMALAVNNGAPYILLEKIPGTDFAAIPSIASAEIITSDYGIVINDAVHDKTLFFANNDPESLAKMASVKSYLNSNSVISKVFGVTVVNVPN